METKREPLLASTLRGKIRKRNRNLWEIAEKFVPATADTIKVVHEANLITKGERKVVLDRKIKKNSTIVKEEDGGRSWEIGSLKTIEARVIKRFVVRTEKYPELNERFTETKRYERWI